MTDDELLDLIRARIAADDHLSAHLAKPGKGTQQQQGGVQFFMGSRRTYYRGSADLAEARRRGDVEPLPVPVPATVAQVAARESELGARLPAFVRRLYLEIGDGGFGPMYGFVPLRRMRRLDVTGDLEGPAPANLPEALLMVTDEGCGISTMVCSDDRARRWVFDPNRDVDGEVAEADEDLRSWLADWLRDDGELAER